MGASEVIAEFDDLGHAFSLALVAIPFGGPCAGYGLLLSERIDEEHAARAAAYFRALSGPEVTSPALKP